MAFTDLVIILLLAGNVAVVKANNCWNTSLTIHYTVGPSTVTVTQSDANVVINEVLTHGKNELRACSGLALKLLGVAIATPGGLYSITGTFGVVYGSMSSSQKTTAQNCLNNAQIFNDIILRPDYYVSPLKGSQWPDRASITNYLDSTCCFNGTIPSNGVCVSPAPSVTPSSSYAVNLTSFTPTPSVSSSSLAASFLPVDLTSSTPTPSVSSSSLAASSFSLVATTVQTTTTVPPTSKQIDTTERPTTRLTTERPTTRLTTERPTTRLTTERPTTTPIPTTRVFLEFVNFETTKRVSLGGTVKLFCGVVGTASNVGISWYRENAIIDDSIIQRVRDGINYTETLTIKDVKTSNAGIYECDVKSSIGTIMKSLKLEVEVSDQVKMEMSLTSKQFHSDLSNSSSTRYLELSEEFRKQASIVLRTKINGLQKIEVSGFRRGSVIVDFIIFMTQILSQPQSRPPDLVEQAIAAMIQQVTTGSFGNYSVDINSLFLKVIPLPPINIRTENKGTMYIELKWDKPDKSYHIKTYVIKYKKAESTEFNVFNVSSSLSIYKIDKLEKNTKYEFQMYSINDVDKGPFSPLIKLTTLSVNPVIANDGQEFFFIKGETAVLVCSGSSEKMPNEVKWISPLPPSAESYQNETKNAKNMYMILKNVEEKNAGTYKCSASYKDAIGYGNVTLSVIVPIEVNLNATLIDETFTDELQNESSQKYKRLKIKFETELAKVYANFTGFERVEVIEFINGSVKVRFRVIVKVKVEEKRQLNKPTKAKVEVTTRIIQRVKTNNGDLGGGLIVEENSIKTDSPPPSPRNVTVTEVHETMAHLRWIEPEAAYVFSIHTYTVKLKKFGKPWKEKVTTQHIQLDTKLDDLEHETSYTVMVFAKGDGGVGLDSEQKEFKTKETILNLTWLWICLALLLVFVISAFLVYRYKNRRTENQRYDANGNRAGERRTSTERDGAGDRGTSMEYPGSNKNVCIYSYRNEAFALNSLDFESIGLMPGKWWEIPRSLLTLGKKLGSGAFGMVKEGTLELDNGPITCAVKMLKSSAGEDETRDLINELDIIAGVRAHDNLVNLIGACTYGGPLLIVLEFAESGSLLDYVSANVEPTPDGDQACSLPDHEKLQIGWDIASGMQHLANSKCVHRDLAARNVLLTANHRAKIADFGMSRDVYERGFYEKQSKGKLPIRWMAPEAIQQMMFTTKGDVWSYGVVLWEIEAGGKLPYAALGRVELIEYLKKGRRLPRPGRCKEGIYNLMLHCWHMDPGKRPSFDNMCTNMEALLSQAMVPQVTFPSPFSIGSKA